MNKIIYSLFIAATLTSCSSTENDTGSNESTTANTNSLIRTTSTPIAFGKLTKENIVEAAEQAVIEAQKNVDELLASSENDYESTVGKLDAAHEVLASVLYPMELFYETNPDKELREGAKKADEIIKTFQYALAIRDDVYQKVKLFDETGDKSSLSDGQKEAVRYLMLEYKQAGMHLSQEEREEIKRLKQKIDVLGKDFTTNIAQNQQNYILNAKDTAGIDQGFLAANLQTDGNYSIDMSYPSHDAVITYAKSGDVRKAYMTLFKNRGMPGNTLLLDSVIYYRTLLANKLGYDKYADYALAKRMALTKENVWNFENDLNEKIRVKAQYDYDKLLAFKSKLTGSQETIINEWELSYYTNLLKKEQFQLDDQKLSEYFELNKVINGLFDITQELLGLRYEEIENPDVWYNEVRMFNCFDIASGKQVGRFYLDLFPRENKYSHAACFPMNSGKLLPNGEIQIAEASLVCNFTKPEGEKPALLKHGEVETFFHEFGHLIHAMVAKSDVSLLSGLDQVKMDFVEAPSQIYENWAYLQETLSMFAKHYKTGEVIPEELVEKIIAAKNLNSGLAAQKQVFYASYDMTLHDKYVPFEGKVTMDVTKELYKEILLFQLTEGTNFEANFGHLVGYGSGYYGYMWSKVYAQDMWSKFEEEGAMNKELGMKYRKLILEPGGAKDHLSMVKQFLGRDPNAEALLKDLGVSDLK